MIANLLLLTVILYVFNWNFSRKKKLEDSSNYYSNYERGDRIFMNTMVLTAFIASMVFMTMIVRKTTQVNVFQTVKIPVVSTNRSNTIEGEFLIGSGTVNSERVYTVMTVVNSNSYVEHNIPQNTIIVEDTTVNSSYYSYEVCDSEKSTFYNIIVWSNFNGCENNYHFNYELHIPKGSVIKNFNVR